MNTQQHDGLRAVWVSLISNVLLTLLKLAVGLLTGSNVLVADGMHNAGDVIATFAALSSAMVSKKPADEDHPYGHGKAEVVASGIVSVILIIAALLMVVKSVEAFFEPPGRTNLIALAAAALSFVWKQWLYVYCIRLGRKLNSKSLIATAQDHLADVYASIAAVIGIGTAWIGDMYHLPFAPYGDPIAGIVVSYFVLKLAYHMGREAIDILMERTIPAEQLDDIRQLVGDVPRVMRVDRLRARDLGHYTIVDVRVSVPSGLTIQEGHDIGRLIKATIMDAHGEVEEVLVHLNPWYPE